MKKVLLIVICLGSTRILFAQKGIKGLINAEKQFAWFTATHTVKEGFLSYMDSTGIIFRQGAEHNAWNSYKKQPASPGILNWEPALAVISASGDMGATTGPYEFKVKTIQDTPVGRGTFFSVWRINAKGEWKNLADFGSVYKMVSAPVQQVKEMVLPKQKTDEITSEEVAALDNKFNLALQQKNVGGWMPYISTDSWLNLDGQLPLLGMLQMADALQKIPSGLVITQKAIELSSAKDFAYSYGTVVNGNSRDNYLRVWIYRQRQWQVILQTLKW